MSKTAHYDPNGWKQFSESVNYLIKVYSLSFDGKKTLIADVFNVDQEVLLKILDVYGNANFEIHIVSIANVKEVIPHEIL